MRFKSLLYVTAFLPFIFLSALTAYAQEIVLSERATVVLPSQELLITFESSKPVPNACALIVGRFEYLKSISTLVIEAKNDEPCLVDRFGVLKGSIRWRMPNEILNQKNALAIVLNGKRAGCLQISNHKTVVFSSAPNAQCLAVDSLSGPFTTE